MNRSTATPGAVWEDALRGRVCPGTLVVGIGNTLKSDDGVGSVVATRLATESGLRACDCGTAPENFLFQIISWKPKSVLVVDAVDFNGYPGEVRVLESGDLRHADISTHAISPQLFASAIQDATQAEVFFLAVQPRSTMLGGGFSPEVAEAANRIVSFLSGVLAHRTTAERGTGL